jgi:hypothetical protein
VRGVDDATRELGVAGRGAGVPAGGGATRNLFEASAGGTLADDAVLEGGELAGDDGVHGPAEFECECLKRVEVLLRIKLRERTGAGL